MTSIFPRRSDYLAGLYVCSILLVHNKTMANDHRILILHWILSADREMGKDRRNRVPSSSNTRTSNYDNLPLIKTSKPRWKEDVFLHFGSRELLLV